MPTYTFPENFVWGTSTASAQIETASGHDWRGVRSKDGFVFERTCDHELRRMEDAEIICDVSNAYRMSMDWARLQPEPGCDFVPEVVKEYVVFLKHLKQNGMHIMLVLHHFTNPLWFARSGGWENPANIPKFLDFSRKLVQEFGAFADSWNTFNEPGVYVSNGWVNGEFPPFKKNPLLAFRVIANIGKAHDGAYDVIKAAYPDSFVGISKNTVIFKGETWLGSIPARIADWWFMEHVAKHFVNVDFVGMSYYAKIGFDPGMITEIHTPGKLDRMGRPHDDMWEYYPEGLRENIHRFWAKFRKPIIITENGICTKDDNQRISAIRTYTKIVHDCIAEGIDIRGYFFWSVFDNFEWNLGPTFQFGLYEVDLQTMERTAKPSAAVYKAIASTNSLVL